MSKILANKQEVIAEYKTSEVDSGSVFVQCGILTERIAYLAEHVKNNKFDHDAKRGLLGLVAYRRKLLRYIKKNFTSRYTEFTQKLADRLSKKN
jgi:small subunit ribosomal protein S15